MSPAGASMSLGWQVDVAGDGNWVDVACRRVGAEVGK
jgi:hypothetical protein